MSLATLKASRQGTQPQWKKTPLSDQDAVLWREGIDREILTIVTNIAILDGCPNHSRLLRTIEQATLQVPRLRQVIRPARWGELLPHWQDDAAFALCNHVHLAHLPANATDRDLLDLAASIMMHAFGPELPMWSVTLVDGLEHGRTALIIKRHHALMDGTSLAKLVLEIAENSNGPTVADTGWPPAASQEAHTRPPLSFSTKLAKSAGHARAAFANFLLVARLLTPAPWGRSSIMRHRSRRRRHYMVTCSFDDLREAAHRLDATLNDVFLAAIAMAMRAYHSYHDAPDRRLRVSLPVTSQRTLRSPDAGNQFALVRIDLPLDIADPRQCIRHFHELILEARGRLPAGPGGKIDSFILGRLPSPIAALVLGGVLKGIDVGTTNVNCSGKPVRLAGVDVVRYATFSELCGAPMNIALYRYGGDSTFGITIDPAAIPDADLVVSCFERALDEVVRCQFEADSSGRS